MIKLLDENSFLELVMSRRARGFAEADKVRAIVADVAARGDKALFEYTKKFDNIDISADNIAVSQKEIEECIAAVEPKLMAALIRAKDNIIELNKAQLRKDSIIGAKGRRVGYVVRPVERAGIYAPGGKSPYPSSVLMCALPAVVAGVEEIIMCTPAGSGLNPLTIAAAHLCGIKRMYKVGGAQAVAAMAYGTESISKADVITGPGNIYVALAKREVFGVAGIDMIAGPSEILVIADSTADPCVIAADLLSQAEHDEMAMSALITDNAKLAKDVQTEVEKQLINLTKADIARKSIDTNGAVVVVDNLKQAALLSNEVAPEHLELCTADPHALLPYIKSAGAVFMGHYSPEPLGDYFAGPNHVLPTEGSARFFSSLGVDNYIKKISIIEYDKKTLQVVKDDVIALAEAEGFGAHAEAVKMRFTK